LDIQKKEDTEQINRLLEEKKLNPATLTVNPLAARRRGVLNHRLMYGTLSSHTPRSGLPASTAFSACSS
jgi:hypothetical protein